MAKDPKKTPCTLGHNPERWSPPNREAALVYQLHDLLPMLLASSYASQDFGGALAMVESYIAAYRQMSKAKGASHV